MTAPVKEYRRLLNILTLGQVSQSISGDLEAQLLDRLDDLWWAMSPEDQTRVDYPPPRARSPGECDNMS